MTNTPTEIDKYETHKKMHGALQKQHSVQKNAQRRLFVND